MKYSILFDYNGVIANDEHLQFLAFKNIIKNLGLDLSQNLYDKHFLGKTDYEGFLSLANSPVISFPQNSIDALVREKTKLYQKLSGKADILYPGVESILSSLSKVFKLAIITGSSKEELFPVLERNELTQYFQKIITADDITKSKPDPEGYLKGLSLLGTSADKALVIEDSPSGIKAAKSAGIKCIAVLHTTPRNKLAGADKIIASIAKLDEELILSIIEKPRLTT